MNPAVTITEGPVRNKYGIDVYRSRRGYHPVDYAGYLLLKELNKVYWKAMRMEANRRRAEAKDPGNRPQAKRPAPTPAEYAVLSTTLRAQYEYARHPRETADEVIMAVRDSIPRYYQLKLDLEAEAHG